MGAVLRQHHAQPGQGSTPNVSVSAPGQRMRHRRPLQALQAVGRAHQHIGNIGQHRPHRGVRHPRYPPPRRPVTACATHAAVTITPLSSSARTRCTQAVISAESVAGQ